MDDDRLLTAVGKVEHTAQALRDTLGLAVELLAAARRQRIDGMPLSEIAAALAGDGPGARRDIDAAIDAFRRALRGSRTALIGALVEEQGMTLSEIAKEMSISRQLAARLYQAGQKLTQN